MNWTLPWSAHIGLRGPEAPMFRHMARSIDPIDQIDCIADLGLAGVQDNYVAARTAAEQERVAGHAARRGLRQASFVHDPSGWSVPRWSVVDADRRAALAKELDWSLETARRIGGRTIICTTGFDPARPKADQLAAMADNLRWAGDRAGPAGIALCVEMVSPRWIEGLLVVRFGEALAVVRAADHPAVRLMFDVGHIAMSGMDPLATFDEVGDLVGAVQVADMPAHDRDGKGEPGRIDIGGGTIDWLPLLRAIRASGYAGLYEVEHEAEGEGVEGERRLIDRLKAVDAAV